MLMRLSMLPAALATTLLVASCTTTVPSDPFKIPREDFYAKFKTIAIAPVRVPADVLDQETAKTSLESLVEAKLREAGFTPVPPKDTGRVLEDMNKQLGGVFDPMTGQRDEAKAKAAEEHARRELATRFKADGVLYANLLPGTTAFRGTQAKWNGTSESVTQGSGFTGFLADVAAGNQRGNIATLSLLVVIEDIQGVRAFINLGGIQLLNKVSGGRFVQVPRNELLTNKERNAKAVEIALGPLTKSTTSADPKPQP